MKYLIHLLSALVPKRLRASWREEWRAEISAVKETRGIGAAAKLAAAAPIDAASSRWTTDSAGSAWRTDLKQTVRSLFRSPGHVAVVSLCLGIGIAVATTTFSILNAFMYGDRPGIEGRARMPRLYVYGDKVARDASLDEFAVIADGAPGLAGIAAEGRSDFSIRVAGHEPMHVVGAFVNGQFFQTLGSRPALGRLLIPADDQPGAPLAVVVSHAFWKGRLGSAHDIAGRPAVLGDRDAVIVGVAPEGFLGLAADDTDVGGFKVYVPMTHARTWPGARNPANSWFNMAARLREGVDAETAAAEMQPIAARLENMNPQRRKDARVVLVGNGLAPGTSNAQLIGMLLVMMAAPLTVLAIGCANVANLQLVRASLRARELAVRASLGASRGQIVRLLTLEAGMLAIGGFVVAGLFIAALIRIAELIIPVPIAVDLRVLSFSAGIALAIVGATGLLPALAATRGRTADGLRSGGRSIAAGNSRIRRGLVVAQVSLCFLLLLTAGIFTRGLIDAASVVPPDVASVTVAELRFDIRNYAPAARRALLDDMEARLRADSRVEQVGFTTNRPMAWEQSRIWLPGDAPDLTRYETSNHVSPTFFDTANVGLLRGRVFRPGETGIIVDEAFVTDHKLAEPVLGQIIKVAFAGSDDVRMAPIVGIAGPRPSLFGEPNPTVYIPIDQPPNFVAIWVRSYRAREIVQVAREALAQIDPNLPPVSIRTLKDLYEEDMAFMGYVAQTAGGIGLVALILAVSGLYSVIAFFVALRTSEFGIRVALGARGADIVRMVVGQAGRLVLTGLGIGGILGVPLLVAFNSMLPGTTPFDPVMIVTVAATLGLTALAASWIPARRASAVDAAIALRTDA